MLLSIIIVSYNTRELLEKCLNSIVRSLTPDAGNVKTTGQSYASNLKPQASSVLKSLTFDAGNVKTTGQPHASSVTPQASSAFYEIIVVDNNSRDDSVEMLENLKFKIENLKLKIIVNNNNTGFAKANNQGIKIAEGKYVLFLNPDTIVFPETLPFMLEFMKKNPAVGVATCRVELVDGKLDEACHRGFPTPWNAFCHFSGLEKLFPHSRLFAGYYLGYLDLNTTHEIDSCVGAFMLVPRLVGEKIGWWDEDYFWYGEDIDFCYRVKKAGFKVMFVPKVKIIHYKGASSGIKKTKSKADFKTREKAMLASTQAMRIFYQKHYRGKYPKPVEKLVFGGINLLEKARVRKIKR